MRRTLHAVQQLAAARSPGAPGPAAFTSSARKAVLRPVACYHAFSPTRSRLFSAAASGPQPQQPWFACSEGTPSPGAPSPRLAAAAAAVLATPGVSLLTPSGQISVAALLPRMPPGAPVGEYASLSDIPAGSFLDPSIAQTTIELGKTWVVGPVMQLMAYAHEVVGLEWWAAIVGVTLGLRLVTMPLYFYGVKSGARLQDHQETLNTFSAAMQEARASGSREAMQDAMLQRREYMKKHSLQLRRVFLPIVVQLPMMFGLFGACRRFAIEAHLFPGMLAGGTAFFTALHVPAAYGILGLPMLSSLFAGASVLINRNLNGMPAFSLTAEGQRSMFFFFAMVGSLVATPWLPATVQLYLTATSATMLVQQALMNSKALRDAMGFPASFPPTPARLQALHQLQVNTGGPIASMGKMAPNFFAFWNRFGAAVAKRDRRAVLASLSGSAAAEGDAAKMAMYVGPLGLRQPPPPPPPASAAPASALSPAEVEAAALLGLKKPSASAAQLAAEQAGAVGSNSAGASGAGAGAARGADGKPVLFSHRPKKPQPGAASAAGAGAGGKGGPVVGRPAAAAFAGARLASPAVPMPAAKLKQ